jgi:hypothetical protein
MPEGTIAGEKTETRPSAKTSITAICHKCGSHRVHRSRRRGVLERVVALAGMRFRRCHECNTRFATFGNSVLLKSDVDSLLRKVGIALLMMAALIVVVAVVMWFSGQQESASSSVATPCVESLA